MGLQSTMPPITKASEERHSLQKFLEDGKKYGLRFENGKFSFNVGTGVVLFETYGALLNLEPQSDDSPNDIWMSCAVPKCDYKLKVYTPTSPRNLGDWIKHSQNNHPCLLTDADRKDVGKEQVAKRQRPENNAVSRDQQVSQVKLVVTAGLPLSFVEHPAFRQYNKDHDIPTTLSRRTASRITQELEEKEVFIPRSAILTKVFEPETLTYGSLYMNVRGKISASVDGWTSMSGQMLDSLTITVPHVTDQGFGPFAKAPQLRPRAVWLGLYHLLPGNLKDYPGDEDVTPGRYYSADVRAEQFQKWINDVTFGDGKRLSSANLLHINSDSTNVQPAFIELIHPRIGGIARLDTDRYAPPMSGCFYMECNQHISNLCASDLLNDNTFKTVHTAVNNLSVFLRGSDKRIETLFDAEQALAWETLKKPITYPKTRFNYAILQIQRLLDLIEPMQYMEDYHLFGTDAETSTTFNSLFAQFKAYSTQAESIVQLCGPQLKHSAAMGAASTYTNSLAQVYFCKLRDHANELLLKPEGIRIQSTITTYVCSLYERLASISAIKRALDKLKLPDGCAYNDPVKYAAFKESKKHHRRVYRDDIVNAAALLDPSVFQKYGSYGHNRIEAMTFMVRLIKGCLVQEEHMDIELTDYDESEDDSQQNTLKKKTLRRAYNKIKKEIEIEINEDFCMEDDEFDLEKKRRLSALRHEYINKGLVLPNDTPAAARAVAPTVIESDIHKMVDTQLLAYTELHAELLAKEPKIFGDPFEEKKDRYEFWPKYGSRFPALYFCAKILLGTTLSAMENERFHSGAAYINNKLRSSLTAASISRLTLLKKFLSDSFKNANVNMNDDLAVIDAIDDFFDVLPT